MAATNTDVLYRRPHLSTITYAVGLLLFLLPFFDIKCNNVTMAELSGLSMATGGSANVSSDLKQMQNKFGDQSDDSQGSFTAKTKGSNHLFITALVALLLGILGLVLSLINKGRGQQLNFVVGVLGLLALVASWIEATSYVRTNMQTVAGENSAAVYPGIVNFGINPTFWFFLCLICYGASAYIAYKKRQDEKAGLVPPAAAPQLPVDNPGDQSNFPAAPMDDRELG